MTLGEKLRDLITEMDITQKQLAASINIGASTLGNYIQDNREPDYETLKALADYFSVTTDYLLDHRATNRVVNRKEDVLLRVFRALSTDQQEFYIKQGKLFLAHYSKKKRLTDMKTADDEPQYKDNGAK